MSKCFSIQNKHLYSPYPYVNENSLKEAKIPPDYPTKQSNKKKHKQAVIKYQRIMPSNEKIVASGSYFNTPNRQNRQRTSKSKSIKKVNPSLYLNEATPLRDKGNERKKNFNMFLEKVKEENHQERSPLKQKARKGLEIEDIILQKRN